MQINQRKQNTHTETNCLKCTLYISGFIFSWLMHLWYTGFAATVCCHASPIRGFAFKRICLWTWRLWEMAWVAHQDCHSSFGITLTHVIPHTAGSSQLVKLEIHKFTPQMLQSLMPNKVVNTCGKLEICDIWWTFWKRSYYIFTRNWQICACLTQAHWSWCYWHNFTFSNCVMCICHSPILCTGDTSILPFKGDTLCSFSGSSCALGYY